MRTFPLCMTTKSFLLTPRLSHLSRTLHIDKAIWGPDARDFNPDRWFAKDISEKEKCFAPWSQGYCTCPGQHLAKIEIAKICATIVRDYDVRQVDPGQDWKYEVYFDVCPYDWPVYMEKRVQARQKGPQVVAV